MSWVKVGLFILALCIAGLVGYRFGSDNTTKRWIEGSQVVIPAVVDYAIKRYEEIPPNKMFIESNKELIRTESLALFAFGMGIHLEGEDFLEHME